MLHILVETANAAGDSWAAWMIAACVDSAALLAILAMLWLLIRKKVSPQVGYCLFLLAPIKLLSPIPVTAPAEIARWTPSVRLSAWLRQEDAIPVAKEYSPPGENQPTFTRFENPGTEFAETFNAPIRQQTSGNRPAEEITSYPVTATAANDSVRASPAVVATAPRLTISAIAMVLWFCGVLLLIARFVSQHARFRRRLRSADVIDPSRFPMDLDDLCRCAGVTVPVKFVESDAVSAPAVCGVFRPTVILPPGITSSLTVKQLRWALLHELAHIRRRDLLVILLQRLAAILHFYNPAVWLANRAANGLREYACDDLADSLSGGSPIESGEAFMEVLRYANQHQQRAEIALGVFGLNPRSFCRRRVSRLLDAQRRAYAKLPWWTLCGLALAAAISLPHVRAARQIKTASQSKTLIPAPPKSADVSVKKQRPFELQIVGRGGEPVPEPVVEIRGKPYLTAKQIERGTFQKRVSYGVLVKADAVGRLTVVLPAKRKRLSVKIEIPGYGPFWATWGFDNPSPSQPARAIARLDAGWSVGGVVVDDGGKPLQGVKVHPSIKYKKLPGDLEELHMGTTLTTDARGKWRFDSVPASKSSVFVEINHPDFMPNRRPLTRSEFGLKEKQQPAAKIVLERGVTVTGKVTDEQGIPIEGALVKAKFLNDIRRAKTNADGVYRLIGCEPRTARFVVSAKGRATDMKELRPQPNMAPVNFQMQPGGKIRIRVLDEKGNPIPKARIFFQRWRGMFQYFEFDHKSQYADKNGVWEWNEAPLDEFKADISRPGGMELAKQSLIARQQEYVFRPPRALVITGNVIDAKTKKPIPQFRVIPGVRSSETHMNWVRRQTMKGQGGRFRLRRTHDYFGHLVRIEASGYKPAVSRDIRSNEGDVSIDFKLEKGEDVAATILKPDGSGAAGAVIALGVAGSQINVQNGEIDTGSTYAARGIADKLGRFRFPPQESDFQLVITHPAGYAHVKATPDFMPKTVHLEAWSKVKGIFRVGPKPVSGATITIDVSGRGSYGPDVPSIFLHHEAVTAAGGEFVFPRVIPGEGRIGRRIFLTAGDGAAKKTSSCKVPATFEAGKTLSINLGGGGRSVIGKLQPPAGFKGKPQWNFALVNVTSDLSGPLKASRLHFTATVDRRGAFRIDDMPAGDYLLRVYFTRHAIGRLGSYDFTVSPKKDGSPDRPIDLGTLTLED